MNSQNNLISVYAPHVNMHNIRAIGISSLLRHGLNANTAW